MPHAIPPSTPTAPDTSSTSYGETYTLAMNSPEDYVREQEHRSELVAFRAYIWENQDLFKVLSLMHLKIEDWIAYNVDVLPPEYSHSGRFNVGFPVEITKRATREKTSLWFRVINPDAVGEEDYNGTVEEKVRVEAGTHVWMRENTPTIPTPHLYGFGYARGHHYTHVNQFSDEVQLGNSFQRVFLENYGAKILSPYIASGKFKCPFSYLVYEHISRRVGITLEEKMADQSQVTMQKYTNLYVGLAKLMVTMGRFPQDKIGSWRFQDDGTIALNGRPYFSAIQQHESSSIERSMSLDDTYNNTDAFVADIIAFQRNRLIDGRNAVRDADDAMRQMGIISVLRSIANMFMQRDLRKGPFVMQFHELDMAHLICDDDWNILYVVDFEFVNSLPVEMLQESAWITGRHLEINDTVGCFTAPEMYEAFAYVFKHVEERWQEWMGHDVVLHRLMAAQRASGRAEFFEHVVSLEGVDDFIVNNISHIRVPQGVTTIWHLMYKLWGPDADEVVARKVADRAAYLEALREWFVRQEQTQARLNRIDAARDTVLPSVEDVPEDQMSPVAPMELDGEL